MKMKFLYIYWFTLLCVCKGCKEGADVVIVIDGSDNVSPVDFLHEVTFVASEPTKYDVSSGYVRFGAILYGSHVTNKISIVPSIDNNQFVNKVTQLKQAGGKPLVFRALTEIRKEFSHIYREGSRRIAIVIISDKMHNRSAVLRETRHLRRAGIIVIPIGVGLDTQERDLKDLLTYENPIYSIKNFSELFQLSTEIHNVICPVGEIFPQSENHAKQSAGTEKINSTNKSLSTSQMQTHTRYVIQRDSTSNVSERGLQIEIPKLSETVDKEPSVRPYFINYSLLGTKSFKKKNTRKSEYGSASSPHRKEKELTGIIIDNDIWSPTSTPSVKMQTYPPESSWSTKRSGKSLDKKGPMYWMAKGLNDFQELLKNLDKSEQKNTNQNSKPKTLLRSKQNTNARLRGKANSHLKTQRTDSDATQIYVITHHSSTSAEKANQNQTRNFSRKDSRPENESKARAMMLKRKYNNTKKSKQHTQINTYLHKNMHSSPQKDNVIYTGEERKPNKYLRNTPKTRIGIPIANSILKTVLTSKDSKSIGNSISLDAGKTTASKVHSNTPDHPKHKSKMDRLTLTNNILPGRQVRPIFTLSGTIDGNVFSGGNSLQLSSLDSNKDDSQFSDNGLNQNKFVHERPQIASNLYSPSNEFYVENGVNSISYKEHFKKLMNPRTNTPKAPYSFDGSKIYSTGTSGPLYLSHDHTYQKPYPTQYPSTPASQSRENKRPFYLTDPDYGHLIPSIPESSTQPNMFNTQKLTTRQYPTFPPNFLEMLGISLEEPQTSHSRNLKSSSYPSLPQNAEEYHHQDTNVHFFRQASYLPSPWIQQTSFPQQLPPRQFRQKLNEVEINFADLNCTKKAYTNDPSFYVEILASRYEIRPCPPGTIFDSQTCGCTKSFPLIDQFECTPELHLNFDTDFSDVSGKSTVAVNRVQLRNSSAVFNGDGELRVWRFSGGYIGNQLMIKLRFKPTRFQKEKQLLVGNCAKRSSMSYGVEIDTKSREMVMTIKTENGSATIRIHFKMFHWNDLVMIYDGSVYKAILNGKKEAVPLTGNVEERLNPLCVGRCDETKLGFQGYIDNVELLFCVPKVWSSL